MPKKAPPTATEKARLHEVRATERDLMKYQIEMLKYSRMMSMLTNLMKMSHDTKKSIIANMRS